MREPIVVLAFIVLVIALTVLIASRRGR